MRKYSPRIVDHFTHPHHLGRLDHPDAIAEAANPCCGDRIQLSARIHDGRIDECSFLAYGCATAIATGSLLCEALRGRRVETLDTLDEAWVLGLTGGLAPNQRHCAVLGREVLRALARNCRALAAKGVQV